MRKLPPFGLIVIRIATVVAAAYVIVVLNKVWRIRNVWGSSLLIGYVAYLSGLIAVTFIRNKWVPFVLWAMMTLAYLATEIAIDRVVRNSVSLELWCDRGVTIAFGSFIYVVYFRMSSGAKAYFNLGDPRK